MAKRHFNVSIPQTGLLISPPVFLNTANTIIYAVVQTSNLRFILDSTLSLIPFQHPTPHPFPSLSPLNHIPSFRLMATSLLTVRHMFSPPLLWPLSQLLSSSPASLFSPAWLGSQMESFQNNPLLCWNPFKGVLFLWVNPKTLLCPTRPGMSHPLPSLLPQLPSFSLQFTGMDPITVSSMWWVLPASGPGNLLFPLSACDALLWALGAAAHSLLKCSCWDSFSPYPSLMCC